METVEPPQLDSLPLEKVRDVAREHFTADDTDILHMPLPPKKERGAREAHRQHLPPDEPVVAMYDATLFGGADDGFLVTPRRLCWKNLLSNPQMIAWRAIDLRALQIETNGLRLMSDRIDCTTEGRAARLYAVTLALAEEAQRRAPVALPSTLHGEGIESLVREHLGVRNELFVAPSIPAHKERNVRKIFKISDPERLIAVYDNTVFGGATSSVTFTDRRLCWKEDFDQPRSIPWRELTPGTLKILDAPEGHLELNGARLTLIDVNRENVCHRLFSLIEAAALSHKPYR